MLIQFSVRNFLSFREEQQFSMVAANGRKDNELPENIFVSGVDARMSLLRSAAMYGANASGKSNFIKAMAFYFSFILLSAATLEQQKIGVRPFKLDLSNADQTTKFEAILEIEGCIYRYGFEILPAKVVNEWLYKISADKQRKMETLVFERTDCDDLKANEAGWKKVMPLTKKNTLLLTVAAQFNIVTAKLIVSHIAGKVSVVSDSEALFVHTAEYLYMQQQNGRDNEFLADTTKFLKSADISIDGFRVISQEVSKAEFVEKKPEALNNFLSSLNGDTLSFKSVETMHKCYDGEGNAAGEAVFDMKQEESLGTGKLFALSVPLVTCLRKGGLLILDELESSLHPLIVKFIVNLFNSPLHNPNNAQLVFTTHNENVLNNKTFRRDQVWFAEKGQKGATALFSLIEFKDNKATVRKDASYDKDYISGRYGAVPVVQEKYLQEIHSGEEKYG